LEEIERFASPNLAQDDSVGPVTQGCFQKVSDSHGRETVLVSPGFESEDVLFLNLDFCRVLNQHDSLIVGDEFRQNV
jgi:hypothetical protein